MYLALGSTGKYVNWLQNGLYACAYNPGKIDNIYGEQTMAAVIRCQRYWNITQDGICGDNTWNCLCEEVKHIQEALGVTADGIVGVNTGNAIKSFQSSNGLEPDGICGELTLSKLFNNQPETPPTTSDDNNNSSENLPDGYITKNFQRSEFCCDCIKPQYDFGWCNGWPVEIKTELVQKLQKVRDHIGLPITISSGVRCEKCNAYWGGVTGSYHKLGRAADVYISGHMNHDMVDKIAEVGSMYGLGYIKYYNQLFVHLEI